MRTFHKVFYSNCLLVAIRLKIKYWKRLKIGKTRTKGRFFPHFYVRSKKSGIRLHFFAVKDEPFPIWHKGSIKVSW